MKLKCLLLILSTSFISCSDDNSESFRSASVTLHTIEPINDSTFEFTSEVKGSALFSETKQGVDLTVTLNNFEPNTSHAVHLHMGTCEQPGHHWNAGLTESQCNTRSLDDPWAKPYIGDVGNVEIGENGSGLLQFTTDLWTLDTGNQGIIGLVMMVHDMEEDFGLSCTNPHSHKNPKVACGVIVQN